MIVPLIGALVIVAIVLIDLRRPPVREVLRRAAAWERDLWRPR